jgi:predicted Co/Zn/Cd cation transporter (cation efflux family)
VAKIKTLTTLMILMTFMMLTTMDRGTPTTATNLAAIDIKTWVLNTLFVNLHLVQVIFARPVLVSSYLYSTQL